ncbi:hypothetical protein A2160_02485 [Candidatus Beckwithbacteria bacterium RBG_13_42_9]|uniref:NAD(P)-binding domain-containing protein n=1 Tax=Candidatus Beckwithbacteria bacterium RBG_13_42_9 TaxID=1797457 RepID=A0A1F5E7E9_9BACT|nr:MAG: hypothetical protein A2160_02485 [Candidatus Beckwithbacteria bacterium RBG_13_42_9]
MKNNFYKNKKILVTGADGFVGSFLTEKLLSFGAKVSIYVRSNFTNGLETYVLRKLPTKTKNNLRQIYSGDLAAADALSLIKADRPEIIFHLAAHAYVPFSFDHPYEVIQTNIMSTLNVFQAAMIAKTVKRIVCTSSSEIYGTALTPKISESHPLNPTSPYAASKVAVDRLAYSYWQTYNLPVTIMRPFNTYGPRHTYDVIPRFIRLALHNQPITIYGNGQQSRDFTYIDDTIKGFLLMGQTSKIEGLAINFGTGKDTSINKIAQLIVKLSQSKSKIIHLKTRMAEVNKLCCDATLAQKIFGWQAEIDIEEGLKRNITWAKKNWL